MIKNVHSVQTTRRVNVMSEKYIKREDALRIFRYLEPPKFERDCWGRLESSAEYDIWKMYYNKLQGLPCIKLQELPCIDVFEKR